MSIKLQLAIRIKYQERRRDIVYVQIAEDEDRAELGAEKDNRGILQNPLLCVQRSHHRMQTLSHEEQ